jgi:hypothetical protein
LAKRLSWNSKLDLPEEKEDEDLFYQMPIHVIELLR